MLCVCVYARARQHTHLVCVISTPEDIQEGKISALESPPNNPSALTENTEVISLDEQVFMSMHDMQHV